MTTIKPEAHLERAAYLAGAADRKIDAGVYEGGDTEFVRALVALAELHLNIAATAAALTPVPCSLAAYLHAPHDGCPGTLDPLAEQQKRGEL
jgi:hypothetical protein